MPQHELTTEQTCALMNSRESVYLFFFFQAEDGIRDLTVTGVQTCALPISALRFFLNLGVGYMIPLGQTLAVKLEGRGYVTLVNRSEERRVGKECRSRWSPYH